MRKALEPRTKGYTPLPPAEIKATRVLINKKLELVEAQLLKEGIDPLADVQDIKRKAIAIFAEDPTAFVSVTCLMVKAVLERLSKVQGNKAQLRYLRDRILALEPCLRKLINDPKGSIVLKGPLVTFSQCLEECGMQVQKYSEKRWWKIILAAGVNKDTFEKLALRLNESINQLNLVVSVEQNAVLHELGVRQREDKNEILAQMSNILQLEEASKRELHAAREMQHKLGMEQKEFNSVLGQQLEASSLEMARKLQLTETEQKKFFEAQFAMLNQRFVELKAQAKPNTVPAIPVDLSIPFYDMIIDSHIKKGSSATIYKGEWCGVPVAIKKVGARLQGDQYKQFINEVNNMSKLRHPNIIQVYGACLEPEAC
ncbi:MAG: protein kinase, partial [Pseudomonadota bacterium]|nr:protein kinase [Pseudomonadota bacterium]